LTARSIALAAEMRELKDQIRAAAIKEEAALARVREEMELRQRRWRECRCGYAGAAGCRCGGASSVRRERRCSSDFDSDVRSPRRGERPRRGSVRWVDEVEWD